MSQGPPGCTSIFSLFLFTTITLLTSATNNKVSFPLGNICNPKQSFSMSSTFSKTPSLLMLYTPSSAATCSRLLNLVKSSIVLRIPAVLSNLNTGEVISIFEIPTLVPNQRFFSLSRNCILIAASINPFSKPIL